MANHTLELSEPSILNVFDLPLNGHTLIEASAGTGKTWTISGLYTRLLLDETLKLKVPEILVVTFTNDATLELKERIRRRLSDVLESFRRGMGVDDFCSGLLDTFTGNRERAIQKLARAVSGFDEASIFTIHGFCQRLLGEAAFESGAEFDLEVILDESEIKQKAVEDFWRKEMYAAKGLWLDYLQVLEWTPEALHKAVRPFTGRTMKRCPLPELKELDALEHSILEQVDQLKTRWLTQHEELRDTLLPTAKIRAQTRAAMLDRWVMMHQWVAKNQLKDNLFEAVIKGKEHRKTFEFFTASKVQQATTKGSVSLEHPIFDAFERLLKAFDLLAESYQLKQKHVYADLLDWLKLEMPKRKAMAQTLSPDDLLMGVQKALRGEQKESFIAFVRRHYRAAMIDEFQDTDPVQCELFETIYTDSDHPLFFVGDPKQAIYAFRGADIHAYLLARNKIDNAHHQTLDTNQRSVPALIHAVNTLFGEEQNRVPFMDEGITFYPVKAAKKAHPVLIIEGEQENEAPLRFLVLPQKNGKEGAPVAWSATEAEGLAAEGVANRIASLLTLARNGKAYLMQPHEQGKEISRRALNGGDIAVLVSTAWQANEIQQALMRRGIPSVRQIRENVFESPEAQALWLILTAMIRPSQQGVVRTALVTDLMGYQVEEVVRFMEEYQAWDRLLDRFVYWNYLWRNKGFMRMFHAWIDEVGADGLTVPERLLRYVDGERRLTNLLHLAELIQTESLIHSGLESLLTWYGRIVHSPEQQGNAAVMRLESDAKRVKIVTVHSSKGLEYPIVFCPYLYKGKLTSEEIGVVFHDEDGAALDLGGDHFPEHSLAALRDAAQESIRLLYVALTRAKHRCYIAWGSVGVLKELSEEAHPLREGLERGFHTAALTWLLHPCPEHQSHLEHPFIAMREHCSVYTAAERIQSDLRSFKERAEKVWSDGAVVALEAWPEDYSSLLQEEEIAPSLYPARFTRDSLHWGWRVASFSGLTHKKEVGFHGIEQPDRDELAVIVVQPEVVEEEAVLNVFNFPKREIPASEAGTCIHAILEHWNWPDESGLEAVLDKELEIAGLDIKWKPIVRQLVEDTVYSPVTLEGHRLIDIPSTQRLVEMECTFPVVSLSVESLIDVLKDPQHHVDPLFIEAARGLSFESLQGYMRGYIDLIVLAGDKYYVLDYKTNRLGYALEAYGNDGMRTAMAASHYYLQYLIYTLALHRYLQQRVTDYEYEQDMGGVAYLFLRGLGDRSGHYGVYRDRPQWSLIKALDGLMGGNKE